MFRHLGLVLALLCGVVWADARAGEVVRVGGYDFPPFVDFEGGSSRGLTLDLIDALNKAQDRYEFRFVSTSARRRYADVAEGRFDLIFFESPEWEWTARKAAVEFSDVFLAGGEVFIASAKPGRGQEWFEDLKGKRLVGILGYHYGFAGFDANPEVLARNWNIKLVSSHSSSIDMVLADRMDVAVVTDAYLWAYLRRHPDASQRLLVSERYDQAYNHRVLVRREGAIMTTEINRLLAGLKADGTLDRLWRSAGITR